MIDGINTIPSLTELITRLKTAIQRWDSKCYLLDHANVKTPDQEKMTTIQEEIARMQDVMNTDEHITLGLSAIDDSQDSQLFKQNELAIGHHQTLKTSNINFNCIWYCI